MQPYCYQRHTVDLGNELPYCHQPIFSWCDGHFAASFLRVLIERAHASPEVPPMTSGQKEALDFLEAVAAEPELHLRLAQAPGDILFLNHRAKRLRCSQRFVPHPISGLCGFGLTR
ncbi:MAG: hypothetical protein K9N62_14075 [Verrucomicrobia bacterium]|nr:hypothetical protein [Verrucomicrobiota bacterium]